MAGDSCAGRANSLKARARDSGDLRSALTEFAPAPSSPLSGAGRGLKSDSKTYAVLLLRSFGHFLLRCNRLLLVDLGRLRALLRNIVTEGSRQLVAVVREKLRIVSPARDGDVSHPAAEQIQAANSVST